MGAGEASIITLTGPFIDDVAPPAQKTLWFGVLNLVRPSDFSEFCPHPEPWTSNNVGLLLLLLLSRALLICAKLFGKFYKTLRVCHAQFPTLGIAGGYIFGGLVGPALGWRYAFWIQVTRLEVTLKFKVQEFEFKP